jgi:hypothetical protein
MILRDFTDRVKKSWERRELRKYVQHLENEAQKPRSKPRPISNSLKTPLRPESNWNWQAQSQAGQNSSSLLLSKLTFDERRQIYQMVFGNRSFHVVQKGTRLAFLSCSADGGDSHLKAGCWGIQNLDGTFLSRYWPHRDGPLHGRPPLQERECRTMYTTDGDILPILCICRFV